MFIVSGWHKEALRLWVFSIVVVEEVEIISTSRVSWGDAVMSAPPLLLETLVSCTLNISQSVMFLYGSFAALCQSPWWNCFSLIMQLTPFWLHVSGLESDRKSVLFYELFQQDCGVEVWALLRSPLLRETGSGLQKAGDIFPESQVWLGFIPLITGPIQGDKTFCFGMSEILLEDVVDTEGVSSW